MNGKRIVCTLLSAVLIFITLTSCGGQNKDNEKTTEVKATAITDESSLSQISEETLSETSTLSPSEISSRSVASSIAAIAKAKADATNAASKKASSQTSSMQASVTSKKTKTAATSKTSAKSKYEVTIGEINHHIENVKRAWIVKDKESSLYVQIARIELDKTVSQYFDSSINSQIVNPKTVTYKPTCSVAVIRCDDPTQLKISKGNTMTDTESIAESIGATIAVNGRTSYLTDKAATIRNGEIYKSYTGTEGKAKMRFVMYRDGTWKFVNNFDNKTAKEEIAKGAYTSTAYQDITIRDGQAVYSFDDSKYRNRTFLGQINANKYVFMTTEFMPIKDAAEVLKAYGVRNAIQINGGNCTTMYVKGIGNTTGTTGSKLASLNKIGYLETEWFAKNGLLAPKKTGGPCAHEIDIIYFK